MSENIFAPYAAWKNYYKNSRKRIRNRNRTRLRFLRKNCATVAELIDFIFDLAV